MKGPLMWWEEGKRPPLWLRGLSKLYGGISERVSRRVQPIGAPCPVISLGSLLMGGSGKTPMTMVLARFFQDRGYAPIILTRGYGGTCKTPTFVTPHHRAIDVGEEALLLARIAPTVVSPRRADALSILALCSKSILLLDDGHQHRSLLKDLCFLVLNPMQRWGNGHVFPAGPLREPLSKGLLRADGVFYIDDYFESLPKGIPAFKVNASFSCALEPGQDVIAFSGLGYPQRFHATLTGPLALFPKAFITFPDHVHYRPQDEVRLLAKSQACKLPLVTTEKDWVKLSPSMQHACYVVHQSMTLEDPERFSQFIAGTISL